MKTTLMGMINVPQEITPHMTLEEALSFQCLNEEENGLLQDNFVKLYYERPTLVNNPEYFFKFIRNTCDILERNVYMLKKAFLSEYNPIENYDRFEEQSSVASESQKTDTKGTSQSNSYDSSKSSAIDTSNTSMENTNQVSAFDTKVLATHDKQMSDTSDKNQTASDSSSESIGHSKTIGSASTSTDQTQKMVSHIHGNIGVTTATQMLNETIDLYAQRGFYDTVCQMVMTNSQCFYYLFN